MKVLYFPRDYTPHDHRFLTALVRMGYDAYYLRLERGGHQLEDRPLPEGVKQVQWGGGQDTFQVKDIPWLLRSLKQVLGSLQPDVVLAGPLQRSALLTALANFHPLVSMSWGYDLLQDVKRGSFWRWAVRYTLQRSDAMVGDCSTIRKIAASYGMDSERIVTFPWGVDLVHFSPATHENGAFRELLNWEEDAFVLLSTRGWEPIYGVDVIARGFVKAAQKMPQLRLLMLGNGSLAGQLRQIFMQGGVQDRVYFPGHISQRDLPRYYRSADLYISASHSDGTSISLLEAMACGKPVIVSDIPGNQEWVTPGEQGWWFPDGDAHALASAIENAVGERPRLDEIGRSNRALVERRANWEKNYPQLSKAFEIAQNHVG